MNQWLHRYLHVLTMPLRLLAALARTFVSNRNRLSRFTASQWVARSLKILSVVTVGAWIAIWLIADDAQRGRLTETVKALLLGDAESGPSDPQ